MTGRNAGIKRIELPSKRELERRYSYDLSTGDLISKKTGKPIRATLNGYYTVRVNGKYVYVHRVIWKLHTGVEPGPYIDHINGDGFDNRIANLREVTASENSANQNMPTGASFISTVGKWRGTVYKDKKEYNLGYFSSREDALEACRQKRKELFGALPAAPPRRRPTSFTKWLQNELRRISKMWKPRGAAKQRAKVEYGKYRCAQCCEIFRAKDVHLDHKNPVVDPTQGFIDWNTYIERLFCSVDGYQVLCKPCHNKKTAAENVIRRQH